MADWLEQVEAEWSIANELGEVETLRPPDVLHDLVRAGLNGVPPQWVRRVTVKERLALLLVAEDRVQLVQTEDEAMEVRFLGPLTGGIYVEQIRGRDSDRERRMIFQHERLPGGKLEACDMPLPQTWNRSFVSDARERSAKLREQLITWSAIPSVTT